MNFKPGDVVILLWAAHPQNQKYVGSEYVIDSDLIDVFCRLRKQRLSGYHVIRSDGSQGSVAFDQVRRKDPPSYPDQFEAARWSDCPWQPARERA